MLVQNVAGLALGIGAVALAALAWQAVSSTREVAERDLARSLDQSVERLRILIDAAEMTVDSAERAARTLAVTADTLRPALENSLAAFEQRPELSYLSIALPQNGEYGNLERTADGRVLLWLHPGTRSEDRVTRNFILTENGFAAHDQHAANGYDPRERPFYLEALAEPAQGRWIPAYQWIVHNGDSGPLWGLSYVKALRDRDGQLLCVLDADFDLPALNRFLAAIATSQTVRLQIVELGPIPRLIGDPLIQGAPLPVPDEFAPLIDFQGKTTVTRLESQNGDYWAAANRLELAGGLTWVVIATHKASLIEEPLRTQLYQVACLGLLMAIGLTLISARMARRLSRPLAELERSVARAGQAGTPNALVIAPASNHFRETQRLGEALNHMAMAVRQREEQLAVQNVELLEAKEQQVASLALKGAIFDSTDVAVISLDQDLVVIEWNAAAERLFGLDREQVLEQPARQAIAAPDGPAHWDEMLATKDAGMFRLAGAHHAFDAELRALTVNQHGRPIHTLFINDISARRIAERRLQQERDYVDAVLNSLPGVFYHYDENVRLVRWNRNLERIAGYTAQELAGADPMMFYADEEKARVASGIREVFEKGECAVEADYLLKDGRRIPYLFTGVRFEYGGQRGFVGVGYDIAERKRAETALRESLARFHAAARATRDAVWEWDLVTDDFWVSDNVQTLFGYSAKDISTVSAWERHIHPDDLERVSTHIRAVIAEGGQTWEDEYRFRRLDGSYADVRDCGIVLRDVAGRDVRMVGATQDITERKQAEARIRRLAMHDDLTGLPNRNLIQDRIAQAISHARRSGSLLAVLYLDLDRFKVVNDGYGHLFGDAVLKAAGERLQQLVRESDTVGRLGGDEFLILLADLRQHTDAEAIARKIIDGLDRPIIVQGRNIHLSGSIGVSVFPCDGETAEALIEHADMAMYRAKELGRNTCQFFTHEMSKETQRRVDLETRLRNAAAAEQLRLVYQPKVNLQDGRITGCEALLRWQHPELGAVSPGHFIPIAEDSGLIVPIGDWVLRTACAQARAWLDAGLPPSSVAVNISVRQFLQQDVVAWVKRTLQETGLPPAWLELEITESLIAQDIENVTDTIDRLKDIGVKLSIDDFGTGYSSLNYLKRFRVDTLKIDQSFVHNMLTQTEDETIVRAVIALAHNLKFKVIAEGVETSEHCHLLREHGCDEIQGYYFSMPLSAEEFAALLRSGRRLEMGPRD
ncbi:cyclic di-GMP signal transduction protein [Thauera linaloolentis 47Lol = DSM 12138]|uniref:Cyclic di-GMP signal transduction protein n=1 Tax=Thauera linaloolentis (strain DSM 12138 / JCM 21573 / CCUG 41526 / CIP 105981 / IAM 15112 / NBRC 102519 / 47Lol) TaxID=1123367 RepID=N6Z805_THAL4|nr:cyclic di-GMP signal transduction protein [Thauera linaloolentis 47Lol = DSM 12138]